MQLINNIPRLVYTVDETWSNALVVVLAALGGTGAQGLVLNEGLDNPLRRRQDTVFSLDRVCNV